jgi:hypothetical protein
LLLTLQFLLRFIYKAFSLCPLCLRLPFFRLPFWLICLRRLLCSAPLGLVLYIDLLPPDVLLDDFLILDDVLTDSDLSLGHRTLLDHDFFLGDRHPYLIVAYLTLGSLTALLDGHPLDTNFLTALWHPHLLAVGAYALTNVDVASFAFAGAGLKLFFSPLHPDIIGVACVASRALGTFVMFGYR